MARPAELFASATAGAGAPDLAGVIANLGDNEYDFIGTPFADATSLDALKAEMNDIAGRWSWARQIYGHVYSAKRDSLGGLQQMDLAETISTIVGPIPHERRHCAATCIAAVRNAFANCRERRIAGFHGDDPLICSCFGVGEDTIRAVIEQNNADSVDAVTTACNAGGGCGSCRMLIQELIDSVIEPI